METNLYSYTDWLLLKKESKPSYLLNQKIEIYSTCSLAHDTCYKIYYATLENFLIIAYGLYIVYMIYTQKLIILVI